MIELRGVEKSYRLGTRLVRVLSAVDLTIGAGEFVAIMGASGSGKSTLLHVLGLLDRHDGGSYRLGGEETSTLDDAGAARVRNHRLGFVFQSFHLLPYKSALDNVALPLFYRGVPRAERRARARALLERLGLAERLDHRPDELSGGQRQRAAIARALVTDPPVILADEPTGNLDSAAATEVLALVEQLHREGRTIVLVTHDPGVAARADRVLHMRDGCLRA